MWQPTRAQSITASRVVIVVFAATSLGSYAWMPTTGLGWLVDILGRAYLHFVLGGMAHEGTHGCLGTSRAANLWWLRVALLRTTIPAMPFRKTHLAHHRHTNDSVLDPDAFLDTPARWQIPLRVLAMPHQWILWLRRHGKLRRSDLADYALTYAVYAVVFAVTASQAGAARVAIGLLSACAVHSFLLWLPFAVATHAGYSLGAPDTRSHEYYGRIAYWFSFGLSLHRVHHAKPHWGWLELLPHVRRGTWWQSLTWRRHVMS